MSAAGPGLLLAIQASGGGCRGLASLKRVLQGLSKSETGAAFTLRPLKVLIASCTASLTCFTRSNCACFSAAKLASARLALSLLAR